MLEIKHLDKIYPNGTVALKNVSLNVKKGEFLAIIGPSGSGKSTLLRSINRLISDTTGDIFFDGANIQQASSSELRNIRSKMGMIFQQFHLIPRKTVLTNVLAGSLSITNLPRSLLFAFSESQNHQAIKCLRQVNLEDKAKAKVEELSGGEQQRVAIARVLMQSPQLILADEPVSNLDPTTSKNVMQYLKQINQEMQITILCNLHLLPLVQQYADRVVALNKGELVYDGDPFGIDEEWFFKIYPDTAAQSEL